MSEKRKFDLNLTGELTEFPVAMIQILHWIDRFSAEIEDPNRWIISFLPLSLGFDPWVPNYYDCVIFTRKFYQQHSYVFVLHGHSVIFDQNFMGQLLDQFRKWKFQRMFNRKWNEISILKNHFTRFDSWFSMQVKIFYAQFTQ